MSDLTSHRTVAEPPRAAVTATLQPDGSLLPAGGEAPDAGAAGVDPARQGRGDEPGLVATPTDEEIV